MEKTGMHILFVLVICSLVLVVPATAAENGKIVFRTYYGDSSEIYVMNSDGTGQTPLTDTDFTWNYGPDWSPNGTKIAFTSDIARGSSEIYVMNGDGTGLNRLTYDNFNNGHPAWSPDGSKIAFSSIREENWDIYVMNSDGTGLTRLTYAMASDHLPVWSPDGTKIAFVSERDGNREIYIMNSDGTSQTRKTYEAGEDNHPAWSPDGAKIAFSSSRDGNMHIYVMKADGTGPVRITDNPYGGFGPEWSPDGTKIAFHSSHDGSYVQIWVMNSDGSGSTQLTNILMGGYEPSWGPVPATVTVTSPNGGEIWTGGTTHDITWTHTGLSGTSVKIDLYCGGSYYRSVVSSVEATAGTYTWTIPVDTPASIDYEVYVTSLSNPTVYDATDANFWIRSGQSITVTSPDGGESWATGTPHSITWDQTGLSGTSVKIDLYKGHAFYRSIVSSVDATAGTYAWTIPGDLPAGTDYEVFITSLSRPTLYDNTNGWLTIITVPPTITPPTITVTSPNGGETWQRGTTHTVTWSYTSSPGANVKIELLKAGTAIDTISASTPIGSSGTGTYSWPISASSSSVGSDYSVKVTSLTNPAYTDTSNSYFTLTAAGTNPTITVTSPNGGETWQRGTTHTVTWCYTGSPGSNVKVTLLKAGTAIGTIIASTPIGSGGTGSYSWPITAGSSSVGSDYKVMVSSTTNAACTDTSNNYFTLTPAGTATPTITVTSPNGGETWQRGTTHTVTWSYTGSPGANVKITLVKAGTAIGTIIASTPLGSGGTGSYSWPITAGSSSVGSDYKVMVTSLTNPAYTDSSNNYFTLTPAGTNPTITVTSPNGGETWQRGTTHTVTWSYTGSPGANVKISLLKAGTAIGTIISSTPVGTGGMGSYSWPITAGSSSIGSDYTVKVTSTTNTAYTDTSNNYFTLTAASPAAIAAAAPPSASEDGYA